MRLNTAAAYLTFCLFLSGSLTARIPPPSSGVNGNGLRFGFGPALGFYSVNARHAQSPSSRMSALIGLRKEIRCDKSHKVFFLVGGEYFFHGLNYRSYYFDQDTLQLYDKSFAYDYSLFLQEIQIPMQVKFSFNRENNNIFSPYLMIGYHLRVLLPASVTVKKDGNVVERNSEQMQFRHPFIFRQMNSCLSIAAGWQKNTINNSKAGFYLEVAYRYGITQYYMQPKYAATSLYTNSSHLVFMLGIKF